MSTQKRIGFLITGGPYTYQAIDTAYNLSKSALQKGYGVSIFLYLDAVIALNKNIKSPGERHIPSMLKELSDAGAKIVACGDCAHFRGLFRENLIEGTKLTGIATLAEIIEECDRFITLRIGE
uniref:Sulfur reduction protein DsrE n=1 Tax=candidate division WOR-3 bacterium TaxID=2052148 RepID=A0A7V1EGX6_UNCW3